MFFLNKHNRNDFLKGQNNQDNYHVFLCLDFLETVIYDYQTQVSFLTHKTGGHSLGKPRRSRSNQRCWDTAERCCSSPATSAAADCCLTPADRCLRTADWCPLWCSQCWCVCSHSCCCRQWCWCCILGGGCCCCCWHYQRCRVQHCSQRASRTADLQHIYYIRLEYIKLS